MKQVRKFSNMVADELQESLNARGITLDESTFEEAVSKIVESVSDSIEEATGIDEEVEVDDVFMATEDTEIDGNEVLEGDYVQVEEVDLDEDTVTITIYDNDGEIKAESIDVTEDSLEAFTESGKAEAVEVYNDADEDCDEDDGEIMEAIHFRHGKKIKFSAGLEKLKQKLKDKKGNGVNKFTIKAGKIVKKTVDQLKADKQKAKTFGKKMKKFIKKRLKSLKKSRVANAGATSGTKSAKVSEGFDVKIGDVQVALNVGDEMRIAEGTLTVMRDGVSVLSNASVDENFFDKCVSEGVVDVDAEDVAETVEETNESADILTFKSGTGYVLVKEGAEIPMGNRVRARAWLRTQGYEADSETLDRAANGEAVAL